MHAVPVTALGCYTENAGFSNVGFLKIDVEGGDLNVLKGYP